MNKENMVCTYHGISFGEKRMRFYHFIGRTGDHYVK
jgi:hypothetical protein